MSAFDNLPTENTTANYLWGETNGLSNITPAFDFMGDVNSDFLNSMPKVETGITPTVANTDTGFLNSLGGISGTLGTAGSLFGAIGGIMNASADRKYKKELLAREDARIARERARQDKFDAGMSAAWR